MDKLIVYAGLDVREVDSYQVCVNSIYKHALKPENVIVLPLYKAELEHEGVYYRPEENASTGFAFTRFLVPHLSGYKGWSLFIDGSDMLFTQPIEKLFGLANSEYAVMVCKHPEYTSSVQVKMDGQPQVQYPRKNWSSVILFNNEHPKNRSLEYYVNGSRTAIPNHDLSDLNWTHNKDHKSGAFLHRFQWLKDNEIGDIGVDWNYLVGEYYGKYEFEDWYRRPPSLIHYTLGGPIFDGRENDDYADLWFNTYTEAYGRYHERDHLNDKRRTTQKT